MAETVTLELLGEQVKRLLDEARSNRFELADQRRTMLMILEWQQRAERRFDDLRTEIGVAVRLEAGNAMQRFEDRLVPTFIET
jgi:hypothetical protein